MQKPNNTVSDKNVFDCIFRDLCQYSKLQETEIDDPDLCFVVFSCEPFGFVFPAKNELKAISNHKLSKQIYKRDMALKWFTSLLSAATSDTYPQHTCEAFMSEVRNAGSEMSAWCLAVNGIEKLKEVLNGYMPGYNVGWDCGRIGDFHKSVFFVKIWINLDVNSLSPYKKLYRAN